MIINEPRGKFAVLYKIGNHPFMTMKRGDYDTVDEAIRNADAVLFTSGVKESWVEFTSTIYTRRASRTQ